MPHRSLAAAAALLGFLGVALGAFGAHALRLAGQPLDWWRTGTEYHLAHALAAILAAVLGVPRAGWLFIVGTVLFAGSLYAMALSHVLILGAVAPLGGLCYLLGWGALAWGVWRTPAPTS